MNKHEIISAIDAGKRVYWSNKGYPVIKDNIGQYLITCTFTDYCIGLYGHDGKLNGDPDSFFIEGGKQPIDIRFTVHIDKESWLTEYGIEPNDFESDVRQYIHDVVAEQLKKIGVA